MAEYEEEEKFIGEWESCCCCGEGDSKHSSGLGFNSGNRGPPLTPTGSFDHESPLTATDMGSSSISSSDMGIESLHSGKKEFSYTCEVDENLNESHNETNKHCL